MYSLHFYIWGLTQISHSYLPLWVQTASSMVVPKDLLIRQMKLWSQFSQATYRRATLLGVGPKPVDFEPERSQAQELVGASGMESDEMGVPILQTTKTHQM